MGCGTARAQPHPISDGPSEGRNAGPEGRPSRPGPPERAAKQLVAKRLPTEGPAGRSTD